MSLGPNDVVWPGSLEKKKTCNNARQTGWDFIEHLVYTQGVTSLLSKGSCVSLWWQQLLVSQFKWVVLLPDLLCVLSKEVYWTTFNTTLLHSRRRRYISFVIFIWLLLLFIYLCFLFYFIFSYKCKDVTCSDKIIPRHLHSSNLPPNSSLRLRLPSNARCLILSAIIKVILAPQPYKSPTAYPHGHFTGKHT